MSEYTHYSDADPAYDNLREYGRDEYIDRVTRYMLPKAAAETRAKMLALYHDHYEAGRAAGQDKMHAHHAALSAIRRVWIPLDIRGPVRPMPLGANIAALLGDDTEGDVYPTEKDIARADELNRYLSKATDNLAEQAAQDARAELIEHYRRACSRHYATGAGRLEAHRRALKDLGPAWKLRWHYSANLLTRDEDQHIRSLDPAVPNNWFVSDYILKYCAACCCVFGLLLAAPDAIAAWLLPVVALAAVAYCVLSIRHVRRLMRQGQRTKALRAHAIYHTFDYGAAVLWWSRSIASKIPEWYPVWILVMAVGLIWGYRANRNLANKLKGDQPK